MNDEHLKPLSAAVLRLFRPLVRILLRNGVSYRTFADLAKWVYVDVATKEFSIRGRKQSTSSIPIRPSPHLLPLSQRERGDFSDSLLLCAIAGVTRLEAAAQQVSFNCR